MISWWSQNQGTHYQNVFSMIWDILLSFLALETWSSLLTTMSILTFAVEGIHWRKYWESRPHLMFKPVFFRWCFCFSPLLDGQFLSLVDSRSYSTPSTNTAMPKTSKQINYSLKILSQTSPSYLHTVERSVYLQTNISLIFQKKNSPWKLKMFVYDYKCAPPFIIDTVSNALFGLGPKGKNICDMTSGLSQLQHYQLFWTRRLTVFFQHQNKTAIGSEVKCTSLWLCICCGLFDCAWTVIINVSMWI